MATGDLRSYMMYQNFIKLEDAQIKIMCSISEGTHTIIMEKKVDGPNVSGVQEFLDSNFKPEK
jgi:hypothetical protein